MSTASDNIKYKWTPESTSLLISVWSDRQVQKQLEYAPRPQMIWENVARYMRKKGYDVTAKHCRSRMKQVLVCYREAKRAGTRSGVEQYYEIIDRVLKNKRVDQTNVNGIDTVDATANIKSPSKDVKTNKNLQMRLKVQEPVQSLFRTDALSPTWTVGQENEYPDSPESNETIIAKPYRVFSPTRDIAINTGDHFTQLGNRTVQTHSMTIEEDPIRENYRQNLLAHYSYGEIPYQNTVQNVQNQIIQENMQQHQNIQQSSRWNQLLRQNKVSMHDHGFQQNVRNYTSQRVPNNAMMQNFPNVEMIACQQNHLQQNALQMMDNQAMPQEPRKISFGPNLTNRVYKQYKDAVPRLAYMGDVKQNADSPDYSPDTSVNLNDAFCQSKSDDKSHNLNETYVQPGHPDNPVLTSDRNATIVTNNATCNDDTLLLDFLLESPSPTENVGKSRDSAVNTDTVPSVPFRKKKAQKIEQLVLSAISSQNEVVNKILVAQNDMVARFLDVDRDRQNRLENRLDRLLNVVQATVLNKNTEAEREASPPLMEPMITSLLPPPKPGMIPPKLDLVPPKPCRVPCTMPSSNVNLINQNPVMTRPGIVSPINSPEKRKLGTIWSKLGPVSQSPFVKAQQRLGLQFSANNDARTQSSVERRIARELDKPIMNARSMIYETAKLLEIERQLEEKIENARLEVVMSQTLTARRKLFTQHEPTPIMILTAAFLDAECRIYELDPPYYGTWNFRKQKLNYARLDNLLAGQGESYERMRHLNATRRDCLVCEPCDSSTPAKLPSHNLNDNIDEANGPAGPTKQSIQQLARLLMNSARWRDPVQHHNRVRGIATTQPTQQDVEYNATFTAPMANAPPLVPEEQPQFAKSYDAMHRRQSGRNDGKLLEDNPHGNTKFPMGFTTTMLIANNDEQKPTAVSRQTNPSSVPRTFGFVDNPLTDRKINVRFLDEALTELQQMYIERQVDAESRVDRMLPILTTGNGVMNVNNRNMIERYVSELPLRKTIASRDKDTESDNEDEFLDTTTSMHPTCVIRRGSLTSSGTVSTETTHSLKADKAAVNRCTIT